MKWWEEICSCCALCCHEKAVTPEFLILDLSAPCAFLDEESSLCSVYKERRQLCRRCRKVTLFMAMFSPSLPEPCAYVSWAKRHHIRFARRRELIIEEAVLKGPEGV